MLNRERLGLLNHLSSHKRAAITGWTAEGVDQARSEARQLLLILRYHQYVAGRWLVRVRGVSGVEEVSLWRVVTTSVPWLLVVGSFIWARQRTPVLLSALRRRVAEHDRSERRVTPSPLRRAVHFVQSPYVYLGQPISVLAKQIILHDYVAFHIKARPYVFDCKYEKPFETDVHFRVLEAFREH